MGLTLGSDVPFFLLESEAALGRGRGEVLRPIPSRLCGHFLLHYPGFPSPTGEVYALLARKGTYTPESVAEEKAARLVQAMENGDLEMLAEVVENDLEEAVLERFPELRRRLQTLREAGARVIRVSGAGSSIFGLFASLPASLPSFPTGSTWAWEFRPCKNYAKEAY